ncbi:MAG: GIY-YIG nuclease family protein [Planctomycetota bacterium]
MVRSPRWSVYLVRRADGALYTGVATDVTARFAAHCAGRGAKALRGRGPLTLVFRRRIGDRGRALQFEQRIKRLRKADKERLVASHAFARRWFAVSATPGSGRRARPAPAS